MLFVAFNFTFHIFQHLTILSMSMYDVLCLMSMRYMMKNNVPKAAGY